jgi:predicted dehydrogenase
MNKPLPGSPTPTPLSRRRFLHSTAQLAVAAGGLKAAPWAAHGQVPSPNARLGVGFIGIGSRAGAHLQSVHWLKTQGHLPVEIVALHDLYRPRLRKAADNWKVKAYADWRELLADPAVDVVCIATPDHHHCPQAIAAVQAGKHVYCEKPLSHWRQFPLVKKLAQEVKQAGRVVQVGVQYLTDPAYHQMRKLVQEGLIGPPIHAECGLFRVGDWGERGMPIDDPQAKPGPDLDWEGFLGDAPRRPFDASRFFRWRMYEDYAGGPVTDLYPHTLSPVVWMLGVGFPRAVVATGGIFRYPEREVPDTFNMLIDYPEKLTVAVLGTQGNDYEGTGGRPPTVRVPILRGWDGSLTIRKTDSRNAVVFIPAEGAKKPAQEFPVDRAENLTLLWQNLIECCLQGRTQTWSPMDLAYPVQTALIMGMLAYRAGRTARFNLDKEEIVV